MVFLFLWFMLFPMATNTNQILVLRRAVIMHQSGNENKIHASDWNILNWNWTWFKVVFRAIWVTLTAVYVHTVFYIFIKAAQCDLYVAHATKNFNYRDSNKALQCVCETEPVCVLVCMWGALFLYIWNSSWGHTEVIVVNTNSCLH